MLLASVQQLLLSTATCGAVNGVRAAAAGIQHLKRCSSASSQPAQPAQAAKQQTVDLDSLTPEQQQHVKALQFLVQRPLEAAHNAAALTALTASYRDLYVVMDQMHKKDILGIPRPLSDEPPRPRKAQEGQEDQEPQQQPAINHTQMFYPVRDFTLLPDKPEPVGGWLRNHLKKRYMSRPLAWAQLLPNHLEVSYQTGAMITLWPAMESFYPRFIDFEGVKRYMQRSGLKRKRWKRSMKNKRVKSSLGWQKVVPYHNRRQHY